MIVKGYLKFYTCLRSDFKSAHIQLGWINIIELLKLWRQDSSKSNTNSMGFLSSHVCLLLSKSGKIILSFCRVSTLLCAGSFKRTLAWKFTSSILIMWFFLVCFCNGCIGHCSWLQVLTNICKQMKKSRNITHMNTVPILAFLIHANLMLSLCISF